MLKCHTSINIVGNLFFFNSHQKRLEFLIMLVKEDLGKMISSLYNIQTGEHDPYVDCVSVMRLYKRMGAQDHQVNGIGTPNSDSGFESQKAEELENMTPDELYQLSKSNYKSGQYFAALRNRNDVMCC
ncbi:hypothetical protein DKX38_003374 [Salix brachista]|uniref:Uncharacterized protein n=1 Tax=Salix brachista TaxID=2182728 RepID=A0A5N5NSE2_9ROSI|nr:hypothetical protein DKX38_003374 [Salix brachista]